MSKSIPCTDCGFDLATLPITIPQAHAEKPKDVGVRVHCPLCGKQHTDLMRDRGFFLRETRDANGNVTGVKWQYWHEGVVQTQGVRQGPRPVPIGELKIQFGEEAAALRPSEIHFRTVPVFVHPAAREQVRRLPALPVKPEFLDCLDPKALGDIRSGATEGGRFVTKDGREMYECTIPLRAQPQSKWLKVTLPLSPPIEGVFLRHWPNVDDIHWRYHLVSLGFDAAKGKTSRQRTWRVQAWVAGVKRDERQDYIEVENELYPFDLPAPGAKDEPWRVYSIAIEGKDGVHHGRPAWISVDLGEAGGVFAMPRAGRLPQQEAHFGLDFGTSNTVIAERKPSGAIETCSPGSETTRWIFGEVDLREDPDDLWPGTPWTGQHRDLLPSELLLTERSWPEFNGRPDRVTHELQLGVEVGVPLVFSQRDMGRKTLRPQSLLSDFKWELALQRQGLETLASETWRVQAKFIEAALLMALASRVKRTGTFPNKVQVTYSYPPAFSKRDMGHLESATGSRAAGPESVADRLRALLSMEKAATFIQGADEANAAVFDHDPNREFAVFGDIGGGSLEVGGRDEFAPDNKAGHDGLEHVVASKSLRFGGGVYLHALVDDPDKRCVAAGVEYPEFASRVRRYPTGRDLIRATALFGPNRVAAAKTRAIVFGDAVADYVARTLAGLCLEHGFQAGTGGDGEARLNLTQNRLFFFRGGRWHLGGADARRTVRFTIFLLGNGWNTVDIAVPEATNQSLEEYFAGRVRARLQGLIQHESTTAKLIKDEAGGDLLGVNLAIDCPPLPSGVHRKAVVARELLKGVQNSSGGSGVVNRGVLGLEVDVGGRRIEWYRPFGQPQRWTALPGDGLGEKDRKRTVGERGEPPRPTQGPAPTTPSSIGLTRPPPQASPSEPPPMPPPPMQEEPWHLSSPSREQKGPLTTAALLSALKGQPDAAEWKVWRKSMPTWQQVKAVSELWDKLRPAANWAVALGAQALGRDLSLDDALSAVRRSADPGGCKVWCRDFGRQWKSVVEVPEFAVVLADLPPPLPDDGPPPLDDGPPPLDSN